MLRPEQGQHLSGARIADQQRLLSLERVQYVEQIVGGPDPHQSSTSSRTDESTVTHCVWCGEGSRHACAASRPAATNLNAGTMTSGAPGSFSRDPARIR